MTKLQQLRAIRDRLKDVKGWSTDKTYTFIGELLPKSDGNPRTKATVYGWYTKSQKKPIDDSLLQLLTRKVSEYLKSPDHRALDN